MGFEYDPDMAERARSQYRAVEGIGAEGREGERPAPEPLFQPMPAPAPFPVEALGPLREVMEAATEIAQAPVEIAALTTLTTASLCVQSLGNVEALPLGFFVPASLYGVTLAGSGERKGTVERLLMDGVRTYEKVAIREYDAGFKTYQRALATWTERKRQADRAAGNVDEAKRAKGEAALRALPPEPVPPRLPYILASDPTAEGLWKLLYHGGPGIGLFNEEGGAFLGGYAMGSEKRLQMMSFLNRLWNGEMVDRHRVHDGSASAEGRLAMHIMVQPDIAAPLMADVEAQASGFWARCLICQPETRMGTRFYDPDSPASKTARQACLRFAGRCQALLEKARDFVGDDGQLDLPKLYLSTEAARILSDYNNEIEVGMGTGGVYAGLTAAAGKTAQQAARIAGVMTLFDNPQAREINAKTMADAIALALYFLEEARRLFEGSATDPQLREADALRLWLVERWPGMATEKQRDSEFVTPRDIMQWRGRPKDANAVRALMAILCQHGWAEPADGQVIAGVEARTAWRIVKG